QYGKQLPVCGFEPINPVKPNLKTKGDGTDEGDGMAAAAPPPPPHHDGIARGLDLEAALVAEGRVQAAGGCCFHGCRRPQFLTRELGGDGSISAVNLSD
ncbi:unnamed protein product, partial [Urochloa humidicola]